MKLRVFAAALVTALAALAAPALSQDQPLVAGENGVPVPKKTKHVQPEYPPDASKRGIRGIVILDLVIGVDGRVAETHIIRGVPGLDEAAVTAARQWEFEPVKVGGRPVRVRVTQGITFALQLPRLIRESGVPDLRQGVAPSYPPEAEAGVAVAEVTLEEDGRVGSVRVLEGDGPRAEALLAALQTWRFAPPPEDETVSFRVAAEFTPGRKDVQDRIVLKAGGVQRTALLPSDPGGAVPVATASAADTVAAAEPVSPAAPATSPTPESLPAAEPPAPEDGPATERSTAAATAGPSVAAAEAVPAPPPPPVEVITAPAPQLPAENGVSAIRDVTLAPGVPDLSTGRRPVSPPLARMAAASGRVEVRFSVGAAGATTLQSASGPDLLKKAAEQAVASWVFRRTRADRAYLLATFAYEGDSASATVTPQPPANTSEEPPAGVAAAQESAPATP